MGKLRTQAEEGVQSRAEGESLSFQGDVAVSRHGRKERKGVQSTGLGSPVSLGLMQVSVSLRDGRQGYRSPSCCTPGPGQVTAMPTSSPRK